MWSWKKPGFTQVCSTAIADGIISKEAGAQLQQYPGLFEAGAAVIAQLPASFTAVQQVLGLLHFEGGLRGNNMQRVQPIAADPAKCLPKEYAAQPVMDHVRRELRCGLSVLHIRA